MMPQDVAAALSRLRNLRPAEFMALSNGKADNASVFGVMPQGVDVLLCANALHLPRLEKFYWSDSNTPISLRSALRRLGDWNPVRYLNGPELDKKVFIFIGFDYFMDGSPEDCIYTDHRASAATVINAIADDIEKNARALVAE